MNGPGTAAQPDDIIYALAALDEKIANVYKRIGYLNDKLGPILKGGAMKVADRCPECFSVNDTSEIYRVISSKSKTLYEITIQLDALIERIHLGGR